MSLVELELLILPEHLSSPPFFFLLVLVEFVLFNYVELHVFTFFVPLSGNKIDNRIYIYFIALTSLLQHNLCHGVIKYIGLP
jgi:hypothetical protein